MLVAAGLTAFAGGALATTGWKVFATAQDSGDYGAYAYASADVLKPRGIAVRASRAADVSWSLICDGKTHAGPNVVVVVSVASAGSCHVSGSANTSAAGTLRVQLLRK